MALLNVFFQLAPLSGLLDDERPPEQIFVHVSIRVLVLGALIGVTYLGRLFLKRLAQPKLPGDHPQDKVR